MSIVEEEMYEANALVLAAVDRALGEFGESAKKAILWHITRSGISEEDIPWMPNYFVRTLKEMFGSGAEIIEAEMMRTLKQMGPSRLKATSFPGAVDELRGLELVRRDGAYWSRSAAERRSPI